MYQTFRELVPFFHHAKAYEGHQFLHYIIFFDGGNRHAIGFHDGNDRQDQETPWHDGHSCHHQGNHNAQRRCIHVACRFVCIGRAAFSLFCCAWDCSHLVVLFLVCEGCIASEAACWRQLFFVRYASQGIQGTCEPPIWTCERAACLLIQIVLQMLPDLIRFPIWVDICVDDVEFLTARMPENRHLWLHRFSFFLARMLENWYMLASLFFFPAKMFDNCHLLTSFFFFRQRCLIIVIFLLHRFSFRQRCLRMTTLWLHCFSFRQGCLRIATFWLPLFSFRQGCLRIAPFWFHRLSFK